MNEKTVIITGANAGIGKETAKELAKRGAKVIMACRNQETGKQTRDDIIKTTGNQNVILKKIDLTSLKSIREFAHDINCTEPKLDVLIHNAGLCTKQNKRTADGLEMTMATNHFGPFLLTHLLIDLLKKSAPSRIVVVSSVTHHFSYGDLDRPGWVASWFPSWRYFDSKLANVCFATELARRLKGSNVTVNSLHPGLIDTEIWDGAPVPLSWIFKLIRKVFYRTTEEGCRTTVYLATSDDVSETSGQYFVDCKKIYMSRKALNPDFTGKLWEMSEKRVGLDQGQKIEMV